jgi:hypothetical protein
MARRADKIIVSDHAFKRAVQRRITASDIVKALQHGKRIFDLRRRVCIYIAKLGGREKINVVTDFSGDTIITVYKSKTSKPHWQ